MRPVSKGNPNRSHTPSSSGKRQSTASGRASGLGARTISPTDARRLKRLSMMQAPPLPNQSSSKELPLPPPPAEEFRMSKPELPRLAQQSPSLIPRKTSVATPTSARASPESKYGQHGGVSLSTKSSYASLSNSSANSISRLPTSKGPGAHTSTAQYGEDEDMVPPVPAIPKAYESPKETAHQEYFMNPSRSSQSGLLGKGELMTSESDNNQATKSQRQDIEARRKQSGESARAHQRMNTMDDIERSAIATAQRMSRQQQDHNGRKNANLQPLRLPPLNLMPMNASTRDRNASYASQSQDLTFEDSFNLSQTPEPKRIAKTPSTPMTASKATFFRRQEDEAAKQKAVRSSTSHFALRDLMQLDDHTTKFFEDSDAEFTGSGVPIPASAQRNAITPFSSGSLPKRSTEFARAHRPRPSGDFTSGDFTLGKFQNYQVQDPAQHKPSGPRPSRSGTDTSYKTVETPSSFDSPTAETGSADSKKDSSSGGLRRKLSLGWHRSSSKGNNQLDAKPNSQDGPVSEKEKSKLQKRQSEMPPPRLPASATWTGEIPSIPASTSRPSTDSIRRKSGAVSTQAITNANSANLHDIPAMPKTKSQHSEQPQPVAPTHRSTSWSITNSSTRAAASKTVPTATTRKTSSVVPALSAIVKDKDDLAADEEMRRLSQKRRDVDTAARESEELKKRALARSPMSPERVLHDRNCTLNIFERGEIVDFEKEGIYFTGSKSARKIVGSLSPASGDKDKSGNYGYDDERGDYNIVTGDHLAYRYEVVDVLGKGSFGQVVRCVDHKEGGIVAIKIIRNKKRFHQQALVEVSILSRLREWVRTLVTIRARYIY